MENEQSITPNPEKYDHVDDFTSEDDQEWDEEDLSEDDACEPRGGCMPDPEDFDD